MTTFDDDSVQLHLQMGSPVVPLQKLGLEWPAPERIYLASGGRVREATEDDSPAFVMRRESISEITDEQREAMTHVFRAASYRYEIEFTDG